MKPLILPVLLILLTLSLFLHSQSQQTWDVLPPGAGQVSADIQPMTFAYPDVREIDFDSLNMSFVGNWPAGQSFSIAASPTGDTLFVGEGGLLRVLDITDPYNPLEIGTIRARAIIDDSYYDPVTQRIYLAAYFSGIEVWDVSDFSAPSRICRIPTNSYPRGGVFGRGDYVYIATVADGFYVADISDPENPVMVGHRPIPGNLLIWDSDFQGNYAYLAASSGGLRVIDFSDPTDPVIAETFNGMTTGLCARDTLLFIASSSLGFRILNISDPTNITLEGNCTLTGYPSDVTVSGNYAFIANSTTAQGGGVTVVDFSNPEVPVLVNTYPSAQTFIAGRGGAIGATGGAEGCLILDITDPALPVEASALPLAGFTYELTVEGNYGYTGSNGFRVFDLTDPADPVQVGYHATDGALAAISDTLAIFIRKSMTANNPVNIMSIGNPNNPYKISHYMSPVMTYDLALKDQYAFVACWWDGFRVIDFSNPAQPVLKAHKFGWYSGAVPGVDFCYVQALDISGNYLYLVDYLPFPEEDTKGLYIFDITDPVNPQYVSRFANLISTGQEIKALGDYVYVADGSGGLEVINVSDPYNPFTEGFCSLPDGATGVDLSWPYVYVSDYILGGVQVVDVTDPAMPFVTAFYAPTGVFAEGVTVVDDLVYVGDGVCGFQVYDFLNATGVTLPSTMNLTELQVFPNPSQGQRTLIFNLEQSSQVKIRILDITGAELQVLRNDTFDRGTNTVIFNENQLIPGIYLVEVTIGVEGRAVRIVVN